MPLSSRIVLVTLALAFTASCVTTNRSVASKRVIPPAPYELVPLRIIVDQVYDNDRLTENILKPLTWPCNFWQGPFFCPALSQFNKAIFLSNSGAAVTQRSQIPSAC